MDVNRISGKISVARPAAGATPEGAPRGAAFAAGLPAEPQATGAAGTVADLAASAYTAAYAAEVTDREARRHGRAMLQALARLQHGLLNGSPGRAHAELAALACRDMPAHDPLLRLVLREISVRAAVELNRNPGLSTI